MARGRRGGPGRGKSASPKKRCGSDADLSQIISDNEDRADEIPSSGQLRKRRSSGNNTKLEPSAKVLRTMRQSECRSSLPVSGTDFDSDSAVDSPSLSCKDNNVCGSEVAQTDDCHNLTENDKSSVLEDIKNVEYEDQNEQKQNTSRSIHWSDIPLQESDSDIHKVEVTTVVASDGFSSSESGTTKTADETVKEDNNAEGADQALDNPNTLLDSKSFNIKEAESDDAMEVSEHSIMDSEKLKSVNVKIDEESTSPVKIDESKSQNIVTSVVDKTTAKSVPGIIELDILKPVGSGTGDMRDTPTKQAESDPQKSEDTTAIKVSDGGEACIEESEGLKAAEESFDKKFNDVIIIRDFVKDSDEYEGDDLIYDDVELLLSDSELENELNLEEADTLLEADNDTQPEVDEHEQDIKTSTCSDKSDSSHITGLSFIIGIKGKPASADGKAVQPSFDCVLCNEDFISYTGAAMHSHVTTRRHILNVMKLYSYSMYKQYESDTNIATEKMHSILAGYEKTKGKQHLTMASAEAHAKIRKDVHVHIENIRNKSGDEKDSSQNIKENIPLGDNEKTKEKQHLTMASAEAHAKIRKDVQVDIENIKNKLDDETDSKNQNVSEKFSLFVKYSLFKDWYKKEIKELAKLQANRTPNFISLVVDTRDKNVVLEPKGENPSMKLQQKFKKHDVIQIAENDLEASYDVIKKHPSFDKGTVYVLLGGNYSFMKKVQLPDCKKNCCKNTIYELLQVGVLPVEQALSLHKKILNSTKHDTVIFATLLQITYESFKFHAYNERNCKNIHSIQPPSIESSECINYYRRIMNYNEFAKNHAKEMGFLPWMMNEQFQTLGKKKKFLYANTEDGFNFRELVCTARKYEIRVNAERLRQILKTKSSQGYEKTKEKQHLTMASADAHTEIRKDVQVDIEIIKNKLDDEMDSKNQDVSEKFPPRGYEKTKEKQHLTMASADAHTEIRKDVQVDIEIIKNKLDDEMDSKNQDVSEKFPQRMNYSLFKEWYKKEIKELIKPEAVSTVSKSLQARLGKSKKSRCNLKHDRVVVLTDTRYESFLQDLATKKVNIVAQDDMNIEEVKKYISDETASSLKTLWLFVTGISCLGKNSTYERCTDACGFPIQYLTPHEDNLDIAYASSFIGKIKENMFSVVGDIKKLLNAGDDFAVMPPIPVVIKNENCLSHSELHLRIKKNCSLVYVTSEKYLPSFEIYSTFCDEVANAAVRQCDVNCSSIEYYIKNAYRPLEIQHKPSGGLFPFEAWMVSVMKFILNVNVPSDAECRKDEDMNVDETVNLKPSTRIVIKEADNDDRYKEPSDREKNSKNTSALISRSVLHDRPTQIKRSFDRLVFIGTENLFKCSQIFDKDFLANLPPQSYWSIEYPVNWELFNEQYKNWMNEKNILYVCIPDLSMLGNGVDALCALKKCNKSLNFMTVAPVECRTSDFETIVKDIKSLCVSGSELLVTFPFPRICIQKSKSPHPLLHKAVTHDCNPLLLEGAKCIWNNSAKHLVIKWIHVFNTHCSSDIKEVSAFNRTDIIDWKLSNLYPNFESYFEAMWIQKFKLTIMDTMQTVGKCTSQKDLAENRTEIRKRNEKQSDFQDFPVAEPSSKKVSRQVQEYNSNPYELDQQFIEPYSQFPMPNSSPSAFPHSQLTPRNLQQPDMGYNPEIAVVNNFLNFVNAFQGYCSSTSKPDYPGGSVVYNNPILPPNTDKFVSSAVTAQYVDTTQVACAGCNPDKENKLPHSAFEEEYKITAVDMYSQNFIFSLSDILTSLNNQTVFKKVLYIGEMSLIKPLCKINVDSDLVFLSLEKVTGQMVLSVLKKIGLISRDTVCCLVFNMEVITEEVVAGCCKICKCEFPVQFTVIKSADHLSYRKQPAAQRISHYLEHIQNFVQGLSHHVPVICLPLYPTTLHCITGQLSSNHEVIHFLFDYGRIVTESSQQWHDNIQALTNFWNDLLIGTHMRFPSAALVAKFIDEQITMFPIVENVDDVTTYKAQRTIWMLLTEFIILSLVSPKSSSNDVPVSQIRPGGGTGPVPQRSNVEPLPNMSATKDSAAVMNVLHVSDSIPKEFFSEFITAVDPKASILDKRYPDNYAVSFMKRSTAELVAYKLQDCQIGDTTLQVKIVGNKDKIPALNKALFADITSLFDRVYLKWKSHIYNHIAKKLSNVIDVTSLKTKECPGNCEGIDRCVYYHNYSDKRRNPVKFNYSQRLCSRTRDSVDMCFLGETCDSSHNKYEQLFHPTIFQTVPCPSNNLKIECDQKPACKFAHIDTPEMFFTSLWEDLLVFGTQNTLSYFAGAIRGLKKIASTHADYKVVLISPSREFLDVAKKAVAGVIADYGVSVATIGEDIIGQDCQVFLIVPASLENYQIQIFNDRVGGALIVDNVKELLEIIDDSYGFLKFINQVQLVSSGSAIVNKVFVAAHYDATVSGLLSRNFGLKLKEVKDRG